MTHNNYKDLNGFSDYCMGQVINDVRNRSCKSKEITAEAFPNNLPPADVKFSINWQAVQSGLPITASIYEISIHNNRVARVSAKPSDAIMQNEPPTQTSTPTNSSADSLAHQSVFNGDPVRNAITAQVRKHGSDMEKLKKELNQGAYGSAYATATTIGKAI